MSILNKDKELIDHEIEGILHKRCIGYYIKEKQAIKCSHKYYDNKGRECEKEFIEVVEIERYIPPNIIAITLWLTSRKPESWKTDMIPEMLKYYYLNGDVYE